jgi:hypothetical protein
MTGELLEQWSAASGAATVIPADLVVESVRQTMRAGSWFIFGNFGAVIGNARMSIEGPAIDELLSTLESPKSRPGGNPWNSTEVSRLLAVAGGPDIDPTVRHIMLSSWCYRASHDPRVDPFAALFRGGLLRNTLAHTLVDYAFPEGDFEVHPVTRNLAWASLVEFHLLFGTPRPDALPPEAVLKANRAHVDAACNLVFSTTRLSATHFRSFQLGLQLVIQAIGTDPKTGTVINATRAIMAAHYLYVLTSAVFCGRSLLADTPEIVKDALEPGSPLEVCFEQRQQRTLGTLSQPDVCLSLLHVCRDIFAGRISPD